MTSHLAARATVAAVLLAGTLWGGTAALAPQAAQASIVGSPTLTALAGQPINLGAYEATVPLGFSAYESTPTIQLVPSETSDSVQDLARSWTVISADTTPPLAFTLAAAPYAGEAALATPQTVEDLEVCMEALPGFAHVGGTASYLGSLSFDSADIPFELAFFSSNAMDGNQIIACAALPPANGVESPTLCVATMPAQLFEFTLPAVDQLFSTMALAQPDADRAADILKAYQGQRG